MKIEFGLFLKEVLINGKKVDFKTCDPVDHIPVEVNTGDIVTLIADHECQWAMNESQEVIHIGNSLFMKAGSGDGKIWIDSGFINNKHTLFLRIYDTKGWEICKPLKPRMLKTAYQTDDGYVFEVVNHSDFTKLLEIIGSSLDTKEVIEKLKVKKIAYRIFKELPVAEAI